MISIIAARTLFVLFMAIPFSAVSQAYVAASPSVQLTGDADGLNWAEHHGYNAATGRVFFTAEPSPSSGAPPQKLYEVPVGGGSLIDRSLQLSTVRDDVNEWVSSPDGSQIAYRLSDHGDYGDLFAIDTAGGAPRRLTFNDGASQESGLTFTSDGSRILYLSRTSGSAPYRLYSLTTDGLGSPTLLSGVDHRIIPYWEASPDGLHAYYTAYAGDGSYRLFQADVLGGPSVQLTERPIALGLCGLDAASGRYAYFAAESGGGLTLRTSEPGAGPEVTLTLGGNRFNATSYFRMYGFAGDRAVFEYRGAGANPFFIADPATGVVSSINDGNPDSAFYSVIKVSPNGDSVFFSEIVYDDPRTTREVRGVFQYDVASGAVRELGRYEDDGCCLNPMITHSPLGDSFVIHVEGFEPTLFAADGSVIRSLEGYDFFYDKTGGWLFSSHDVGGVMQLFAESLASNSTRRQLTTDVASEGIIWQQLSSDGSVITYLRGHTGSTSIPRTLYAVQLVPEPLAAWMVIPALLTWRSARRSK